MGWMDGWMRMRTGERRSLLLFEIDDEKRTAVLFP